MKIKAKFRRFVDRVGDHIRKGGRTFLPLSRMRHIRREEAVLNSRMKRAGKTVEDFAVERFDCHCGSVECLGNPRARRIAKE